MRFLYLLVVLVLFFSSSVGAASYLIEAKGWYPDGKDPLGLEKSRVFRVMDLSGPSFICSGFLLKSGEAYYGVTAGHCTKGYFAVKVYYWLYIVHLGFRAMSEGLGRDVALFASRSLPSYVEAYEVGEAKEGDRVFVDGFSGKGRRATNCTVEHYSEEPDRYYKTLRCGMPLYFGMSGSPVVKDGKVVGLITHLFADDFSHAIMTSFPEAFNLFGK